MSSRPNCEYLMNFLQPLASVTPRNAKLILGLWAGLALLTWFLQPLPIIPNPLEVLSAFGAMFTGGTKTPVIVPDLVASLKLNIEAIVISTVLSLTIAYASALPLFRPLALATSKMRYLGLTGITFLFGLLVSGHDLKLALLVFGLSTFFVTSMVTVIQDIPLEDIRHARSLRMGPWRAWLEVVVFGTFSNALEILRQNAAVGLILLTTVELLAQSEGGLGVVLRNVNRSFRMEDVFAVQFLILGIGLGQDLFFGWIKSLLCPYSDKN